ncbi:MAG: SH3 domain-containing protein, partial [Deltaproteobacteria bacterium]|nr:SH3 domain-containing protein [Deltaproteobacteria bacterium]
MSRSRNVGQPAVIRSFSFLAAVVVLLLGGCQELETLQKEVLKKFRTALPKQKTPFVPRDGMTIRGCSLYQTANPNSEVIRRLPAEAPVHLIDKVGEWYRVRTRDGHEGYLEQKMVGGQEIIRKTQELRRSIEGLPPQAEGVTKNRANFRLEPGREHEIIEVLPPGKKFEVYERVVTLRSPPRADIATGSKDGSEQPPSETSGIETASEDPKKDVWYKVKIEDGRVGYVYTHNMKLTPPEDLARMVPYMRMVAWHPINVTEDPDRGAQNNFVVAFAPMGKDPGCDYTNLYVFTWSTRLSRRENTWSKKPVS